MAGPNTLEFNDANFEQEVLGASQPILVDFWAEWCMPCKALGPTLDELASEYAGRAKVGKVNVDDNSSLSVKFGINAIPTIILFKNGQVVEKFVGLRSKRDYASALDAALAG